jgi:hypothetical protein
LKVAIVNGQEQSDETGYGVVAKAPLHKGHIIEDPTTKFHDGEPPIHLHPEEYIKCSGGYFLLREKKLNASVVSATFYLNNAAHPGCNKPANIKWKRDRNDSRNEWELKWEVTQDIDTREELLTNYAAAKDGDDGGVPNSGSSDGASVGVDVDALVLDQVLLSGELDRHNEREAFERHFVQRRNKHIFVTHRAIPIHEVHGLPMDMVNRKNENLFKARSWGDFGKLEGSIKGKKGKTAFLHAASVVGTTTARSGGKMVEVAEWAEEGEHASQKDGIMNVRLTELGKTTTLPPTLKASNWLQNTGNKSKKVFWPILLAMAHKGLQTATHRDSCGVRLLVHVRGCVLSAPQLCLIGCLCLSATFCKGLDVDETPCWYCPMGDLGEGRWSQVQHDGSSRGWHDEGSILGTRFQNAIIADCFNQGGRFRDDAAGHISPGVYARKQGASFRGVHERRHPGQCHGLHASRR